MSDLKWSSEFGFRGYKEVQGGVVGKKGIKMKSMRAAVFEASDCEMILKGNVPEWLNQANLGQLEVRISLVSKQKKLDDEEGDQEVSSVVEEHSPVPADE